MNENPNYCFVVAETVTKENYSELRPYIDNNGQTIASPDADFIGKEIQRLKMETGKEFAIMCAYRSSRDSRYIPV